MKMLGKLVSALSLRWVSLFLWVVAGTAQAQLGPTVISTVPQNLAVGVSPSASFVITFSEEMATDATQVDFYDSTTFSQLPTSDSRNAAHTVLTCTPTPPFPANRLIIWSASGETPIGDPLEGNAGGVFTTGTGGSTGGSGTNQLTTFSVGKSHTYVQTSPALPVLDLDTPYGFAAETLLASNRTANSVSLRLPTADVSSLTQTLGKPEQWLLLSISPSESALETSFPDGNYTYTVVASPSDQQVTINLPATMTQPLVPHLTNFAAIQSVDAAQPFTVQWDPIPGGGAAEYIFVQVGTVFQTPEPGSPGALNGTASSVTIPASTLQSSRSYDGTIGFYHAVTNTFGTSYVTVAFRATFTRFTLVTSGAPGGSLVFTNSAWNGVFFSFEVLSAPGQHYTVDSAPSPTGPWQPLLTTNAPSNGRVQVMDINSLSAPWLFYRARN